MRSKQTNNLRRLNDQMAAAKEFGMISIKLLTNPDHSP